MLRGTVRGRAGLSGTARFSCGFRPLRVRLRRAELLRRAGVFRHGNAGSRVVLFVFAPVRDAVQQPKVDVALQDRLHLGIRRAALPFQDPGQEIRNILPVRLVDVGREPETVLS